MFFFFAAHSQFRTWARPERFMCVNFMLTASGDLTL